MATKKKMIGIRVDEKEKFWFEAIAKAHGMSLSSLIRKGMLLYDAISPDLHKAFKEHSEKMNIPESKIVEHFLTRRIAYDRAWFEVFGENPPGVFREFYFDSKGLVTGEQLLDELYEDFIKILTDLKEKVEKSEKTRKKITVYKEELATLFAGA